MNRLNKVSGKVILIFLVCFVLTNCKTYNVNFEQEVNNSDFIHASMKKLSDVIVHDIFSPPVASRNYVYTSIAAYEAGRFLDSSYVSLEKQLNGMPSIVVPDDNKTYSFGIASNIALLKTAKNFIFSEDKIQLHVDEYMEALSKINIDPEIISNSVAFGERVADQIIDWANKDNYKESRSFPKFSINDEAARWKPTPPGYHEGIEPHWSKIRPFVIKSADQFTPEMPTEFSLDKKSKFYQEIMEVYEVVNKISEEEKAIASFWDCNPYVLNVTGHVMHASKKITPGGHWIGITKIACQKAKAPFTKTLEAYALTSIALADGFISCWDEKYRSNLTRPETVINEHIDKDWLPTLQTPPFPEYTSGHSVISTAAATALTSIFGEGFSFKDDTELEYGLPARNFNSFFDASQEAAVSRLYGGIHYRPAIDNGVVQGKRLGEFVVAKLKFKS